MSSGLTSPLGIATLLQARTCPLHTLYLQGTSKHRMRGHVIHIARAVANANFLRRMNISGHHAGDELLIELGDVSTRDAGGYLVRVTLTTCARVRSRCGGTLASEIS